MTNINTDKFVEQALRDLAWIEDYGRRLAPTGTTIPTRCVAIRKALNMLKEQLDGSHDDGTHLREYIKNRNIRISELEGENEKLRKVLKEQIDK